MDPVLFGEGGGGVELLYKKYTGKKRFLRKYE